MSTSTKHGHGARGVSRSPTYRSWSGMKTRVSNPNRHNAHRYVGRLDMDPRWSEFGAFLADMGERPDGTTLERKDNDRGYWPDNCVWATAKEQRRNTSHNVYVTFEGRPTLVVEALERMAYTWPQYRGLRWNRVRRTAQEAIDYLASGQFRGPKHPGFVAEPDATEHVVN